jgi:hypothetical protein
MARPGIATPLYTRILELLGSNSGRNTGHPDGDLSWFHPGKWLTHLKGYDRKRLWPDRGNILV